MRSFRLPSSSYLFLYISFLFFLSSPTCLLLSLLHLPFAALLHLHYDSYRLLLLSRLFVYFNPRVCPLYHPTSFSSRSSHFTQPTIFLFLFVTAPLQLARLLFLSSPSSSFYLFFFFLLLLLSFHSSNRTRCPRSLTTRLNCPHDNSCRTAGTAPTATREQCTCLSTCCARRAYRQVSG